jgi:hypothetical protein
MNTTKPSSLFKLLSRYSKSKLNSGSETEKREIRKKMISVALAGQPRAYGRSRIGSPHHLAVDRASQKNVSCGLWAV